SLARDFAAVVQLPGRAGRVMADHFVFAILQLSLRSLQGPRELAVGAGLAGVNLRSRTMREQHDLEAGGHGDRIRHVRRRLLANSIFLRGGLGVGEWACRNEDDEPDRRSKQESWHEAIVAGGKVATFQID